jgi:hypothetical protein
MPDIHDFHDVRGSTRDDEHGETDKHPIENEVFSLADKIDQRDGDGIIGEGDEAVRDNMKPDDPVVPFITHAMRHEFAGGKDKSKQVHSKATVESDTVWPQANGRNHDRWAIKPAAEYYHSRVVSIPLMLKYFRFR